MFFNLILINSRKSRKENGLFFASLVVSIIAFYIILSLENQDVMKFLLKMESDAVSRIYQLLPALYAVSLVLLFFLVYFAGKFQMEQRSHELGMYLMMGMRRTRMFLMLMAEDIFNSLFSLLVGIPVAVFLSEMISLIMAKLVGLGIIGHSFSFSWKAVLWTVIGFIVIKSAAMLIFSTVIVRKEIVSLLADTQEEKQKVKKPGIGYLEMFLGIFLLFCAYYLAIQGKAWENLGNMGLTLFLGILGTVLLFRGGGILLELLFKLRKQKKGLAVFTFRQLQENVFLRPGSLAVSSLLILAALCCFGFGVSISSQTEGKEVHVVDYTFIGDPKSVDEELEKAGTKEMFSKVFEVKAGLPDDMEGFSGEGLIQAVSSLEDSEEKSNLIESLGYFTAPYYISLSGYNQLLELAGEEPIELKEHEAALYSDEDFYFGERQELLKVALQKKPDVEISGTACQLTDELYQTNFVVDRSITIALGIIIPDQLYDQIVTTNTYSYLDAVLNAELVQEKGLMQTMLTVNEKLDETKVEYESYLQNMGRQLFYQVALGYITIYLAVIFLIIANTVMGVQYLMHQQKTVRRYRTLIRLGSSYKALCYSSNRQIRWYFGLPIVVAVISSFFGVRALFSGFLTDSIASMTKVLFQISGAMILFVVVVELIYIFAVMRMSSRQILRRMDQKREE